MFCVTSKSRAFWIFADGYVIGAILQSISKNISKFIEPVLHLLEYMSSKLILLFSFSMLASVSSLWNLEDLSEQILSLSP